MVIACAVCFAIVLGIRSAQLHFSGWLNMSSPNLHQSVCAVNTAQTIPKTQLDGSAERAADTAFTLRAMVAVTLLGAGFWCLLCRIVLYIEVGR